MPKFRGATYFDLKGGLNTEASPLNIPVTDATDISNIDINIDGSIERRRSFDFIGQSQGGVVYRDSSLTDYTTVSGGVLRGELCSMAQFNPVDESGNIKKFIICHVGQEFLIYSYDSPEQLREIDDPHTVIDASSYPVGQVQYNTLLLPNAQRIYVINQQHPFGYIEYDNTDDSFSFVRGDAQERIDNGSSAPVTDIIDDDSGWLTGCLSNSRVWLAGAVGKPNTLYFSQTITDGDEYVKMYQAANPYSTSDSFLVDTDGGSITITGAEKILALAPLGAGVIAFANNGVWSVAGSDGSGFLPTDYYLNKISDSGIISSRGWASVEQQLIYFGQGDIYTVLQGTYVETPEVKSIGSKIVSFYNSIPLYNREAAKVVYNMSTKKLYCFVNFEGKDWFKQYNPKQQAGFNRDALVMDVRLAAWSKYSLSEDSDGSKVSIADAAVFDGGYIIGDVVTSEDETVTSDSETVTVPSTTAANSDRTLNTILLKNDGGSWKFGFGQLTQNGLTDFSSSTDEDDAEDNQSYITLAHQVFNDISRRKFAPYIIPIFQRVESGILDVDGVDLTPGGCKYRVDWDWASSTTASKYGTLRDAYIPYRFNKSLYDGGDPGIDIVTSRLKIRGRGEVLRLHFESDGSKDFKLYGWQLQLHAKPRM